MNTGGPKLIHSTSSDGALTVVFNPQGEHPRPTEVRLAGYRTQPAAPAYGTRLGYGRSGLHSRSARRRYWSGVPRSTLETKGSLQPKKLEAIKLQLKGAPQAFTKLYLYALSSPKAYSSAKLLGSVTPTGETTVTLPLTAAQTLPERKSYYYIAADHRSGRRSRPDA